MRASNHSGRLLKNGNSYNVNHNDRRFESEFDKHIDKEKSTDNIYLCVSVDGEIYQAQNESLRQHEIEIYGELYSDSLYRKNEKALEQRHPERVKSMEQYLDGKFTCPEEEILQIGKEGEFWDVDKFKKCVEDYIKEHQEKYPDIKILDAAIHVDETSLHCHLRKTYTAPDKDGNLEAKQNNCLKNLGFELPDREAERGQFNNLKQVYTEAKRGMWLDICDRNLEIELERKPEPKHESLNLLEYKTMKQAQTLETGSKILDNQRKEVRKNKNILDEQKTKIDANKEQIDGLVDDIRAKTESRDNLDHELGEVSSKLSASKTELKKTNAELEKAKISVQPQIEAYKTVAEASKSHKAPSIDIGSQKVSDGLLSSHEEYFVRIPCKSQKEAQKLQKEVSALYTKMYTNKSLNEVVNANLGHIDKERDKLAKERAKLAADKAAQQEALAAEKAAAITQNELYRIIKPEHLGITANELPSLTKTAFNDSLINETVDATIKALNDKGLLKQMTISDKLDIYPRVRRSLGDRIQDFFDKVRQTVVEKALRTFAHNHDHDRSR